TRERACCDLRLRGRRRGEDDLLRPLEKPGRELEPGVLLADDEDAPARVRVRGTCVGVVWTILDARDLRPPRLGDADREDRDLAAIFAVARLQDPPLAVAPRPGPPAAESHRDTGALR